MTTLSNLQLIGEFGWTMEIIHNSTGGRVPKYWRPPYGDADERVIAIAKEVFGLTTVIWNQEYVGNTQLHKVVLTFFFQHQRLGYLRRWSN